MLVVLDNQAWIAYYSVEDDEVPEYETITRIKNYK